MSNRAPLRGGLSLNAFGKGVQMNSKDARRLRPDRHRTQVLEHAIRHVTPRQQGYAAGQQRVLAEHLEQRTLLSNGLELSKLDTSLTPFAPPVAPLVVTPTVIPPKLRGHLTESFWQAIQQKNGSGFA